MDISDRVVVLDYGKKIGDGVPDEVKNNEDVIKACLLYTSDAADERSSVDLGGRRIIKKKKHANSR